MVLDLAPIPPGPDLLVQGLAVGVVPELVDPAQRRVVGPGRGQHGVLQGLHRGPQGRGWHGHQSRGPHVPEQARQVQGPLFEGHAQKFGVAFRVVAQKLGGEGPELLVAGALPAARQHLHPREVQGLDLAQDHQPVQERAGRPLDRALQVTLPGLGRRLLHPARPTPGLLVQPGLQALPLVMGLFRQVRAFQGQRQPVGGLDRIAQVLQQPLPQGPHHHGQAGLGLWREAGGLRKGQGQDRVLLPHPAGLTQVGGLLVARGGAKDFRLGRVAPSGVPWQPGPKRERIRKAPRAFTQARPPRWEEGEG